MGGIDLGFHAKGKINKQTNTELLYSKGEGWKEKMS